ncbi:LytR/AlgR family response regulator transcription factor [candidate division KSB1 bacterium]
MNVIIVEDEYSAARNMRALLKEIDEDIHVLEVLESVKDAVQWIAENPSPELAFFDIQLTDGTSFEIFEKTEVAFPVVFTTAFNEYALKAFKVNSIDYILKPIKKSDVEFAINKYKDLTAQRIPPDSADIMSALQFLAKTTEPQYKKTLLINKHDGFVPVSIDDIAFFFIENGIVYGRTLRKEKYTVDEKLDLLEKQLSPDDFFRANRQYIISRQSILEIANYFNGRLLVQTNPSSPEKILISKARSASFKKWLER